jgi:hypothetical protein
MQFMPATWKSYGRGGSIWDVEDAMMAAAKYLKASGGMEHVEAALYAYNHSNAYVAEVLRRAAKYGYHHNSNATTASVRGGGSGSARMASAGGGGGGGSDSAWLAGAGAAAAATAGAMGSRRQRRERRPSVVVQIDGRRQEHMKRLVRGRA